MFLLHAGNLALDFPHFGAGSFNGGASVPLLLPSLDISMHLVAPAHLLLDIVTQPAVALLVFGLINELETTRLAHPVFLVALLTEVAPSPVPTRPHSLVEIAHNVVPLLRSDARGPKGADFFFFSRVTGVYSLCRRAL
jgi:hypothetical protein